MSDLTLSNADLSTIDDLGKLAGINVISGRSSMEAVSKFLEEFGVAYMRLMTERNLVLQEAQRYKSNDERVANDINTRTNSIKSNGNTEEDIRRHKEDLEKTSQEIQVLREMEIRLEKAASELRKHALEASLKVSKYTEDIVLAFRAELPLELEVFDVSEFQRRRSSVETRLLRKLETMNNEFDHRKQENASADR